MFIIKLILALFGLDDILDLEDTGDNPEIAETPVETNTTEAPGADTPTATPSMATDPGYQGALHQSETATMDALSTRIYTPWQ